MPSGASSVWVNGPLIVGAGPSGLAVAACLKTQHVPFVILERSHCIASLWQHHTYDRLKLHLPKRFCHLPNLPFPHHFPQYPSRAQFLSYLDAYAKRFGIKPRFGEAAVAGRYDETCGMWRVRTGGGKEYICEWLVVATGENGERVVPEFEGLPEFGGKVVHAAEYKSGEGYKGKKVLVVGCGNSGMEICLDLCQHNAIPSMVVRDTVHVLPREVFGKSTFEMAAAMMKWLPLWLVDRILLTFAWLALGNTEKYGLKRPKIGPFQLKKSKGKTPVLDIGTVEKIKSGDIKIVSGINKFFKGEAELMDSRRLDVDAVILATGYRSNVHSWLQESEIFSKDGKTKAPFPDGWKGENGLYSIGFTKRGLFGVFSDAVRAAEDIGRTWKRSQAKKFLAYRRKCNSQL